MHCGVRSQAFTDWCTLKVERLPEHGRRNAPWGLKFDFFLHISVGWTDRGWITVVYGPHFKAQPGPNATFISDAWFRPESQFFQVSQDMRKPRVSKTLHTGIATGTRFYHTQNSNHLDQNIGLKKHKLSLLANDNIAKCKASQKKRNYHQNIHDGAMNIKETIYDSAIGMKSRFV